MQKKTKVIAGSHFLVINDMTFNSKKIAYPFRFLPIFVTLFHFFKKEVNADSRRCGNKFCSNNIFILIN